MKIIEETYIEDKELGPLLIRVHPRARRMTFRTKRDAIQISVPPGTTLQTVERAIDELRDRLLASQQRLKHSQIDWNYRIETEHFTFFLSEGQGDRFLARTQPGRVQIVCPPQTDFTDEHVQTWMRKVIVEALKQQARLFLPDRLRLLARQSGLSFHSVRINSSQGRWGSCSVRKDINLSCYLLLLPSHLIDYVLLHELCHTLEMNHGDRFWQLLNRFTDGKALALRKELKGYRPEV